MSLSCQCNIVVIVFHSRTSLDIHFIQIRYSLENERGFRKCSLIVILNSFSYHDTLQSVSNSFPGPLFCHVTSRALFVVSKLYIFSHSAAAKMNNEFKFVPRRSVHWNDLLQQKSSRHLTHVSCNKRTHKYAPIKYFNFGMFISKLKKLVVQSSTLTNDRK